MQETTLLAIAFFLLCVMFIMLLIAFTKIHNIQKCISDVKPKDMYPFLEELRELVIESERVADKLEDSIKKKEELLEDVSSLADEKIKRLETIKDVPITAATAGAIFAAPQISAMTAQHTLKAPEPVREYIPHPEGQLSIRDRIVDLIQIGMTDSQIASELGVSTTEVQIVRKLDIA